MATNFIQDGDNLILTLAAGAASGAPVMVGNIPAVALVTIGAGAAGACKRRGVFDLSVKAINDSGNSAVAVGDAIYFVAGDTPVLSKKASGKLFGYALEAITSGQTSTINIVIAAGHMAELAEGAVDETALADGAVTTDKLGADAVNGAKIADDAVSKEHLDSGIDFSHRVIAAAIATTAGGAAAEDIAIAGVLETDIVLVTLYAAGSNNRSVVKAVAAAGKVIVTFSGDPGADAKINYIVLRAAS